MDITNIVKTALQEMIVPELNSIKKENAEIKTTLGFINKRLDDVNSHLVDQSRRMDETNKRIDTVREELAQEIRDVRIELRAEIAKTNTRIDRLYEVIVRRDEHHKLEQRVANLERDVSELKRRLAA